MQARALTSEEAGGEVEGALGHAILRLGAEDWEVALRRRRQRRSIEQLAIHVPVLDAQREQLLSLSTEGGSALGASKLEGDSKARKVCSIVQLTPKGVKISAPSLYSQPLRKASSPVLRKPKG